MLKIDLFDDEAEQMNRDHELLERLFARHGVKPDIQDRKLDCKLPIDKALEKLKMEVVERRPHIFVCDNKINGVEALGQKLIAELKTTMPEVVTCILTREILRINQFAIRIPNPDVIISKGALGGDEAGTRSYRDYIAGEIFGKLRHKSNFAFVWKESFDSIFTKFRDSKKRRATRGEIESLIEQCFFDKNLDCEMRNITIESLPGGRSGSVVLTCSLTGSLFYGVKGVVKISGREEAMMEASNYQTYVKWVLPYTWRVEVLGTGITENLGAICYSFAFEGDSEPVSCTKLLKAGDKFVTSKVCNSIFDSDSKIWYSQTRPTDVDVAQYFQRKPFFKNFEQIVEREEEFIIKFSEMFPGQIGKSEDRLVICGFTIDRPSKLIFTNNWGKVLECICHGDLNANNILVNERISGIAFIDFQNTGYHNIYRDFISFEGSIRIDWPDIVASGDLCGALHHEIDLYYNKYNGGISYIDNILLIRNAAFKNFAADIDTNRRRLYLVASYVHFCWLATRFREWTESGYRRLLIGAAASLICLQKVID